MVKKDPLHSFAQLPKDLETELLNSLRVSTFAAGESIFMQGASPQASYLVGSGRVKIVRVTPEGHESILCVRGPGNYFCPVPLMDDGAHLGTAVAMSAVTLFWIEKEEFKHLCKKSPELLGLVQGDCLAEVRHLLNRLEAFAFRNIRERLAIALLREEQRLGSSGSLPCVIRMTQQELAGLVGSSRESVSRALKKMEREGILKLGRGKITICDKPRLKKI
jgi:CRP/FNR family transcriptional regulator